MPQAMPYFSAGGMARDQQRPQIQQRQHGEDQPGQEGAAKRDRQRDMAADDDGIGEERVDPHARRHQDRAPGIEPHGAAADEADQYCRRDARREGDAGIGDDRRIDHDDIGRGQEGRDAAITSVRTVEPLAVTAKTRSRSAASRPGRLGCPIAASFCTAILFTTPRCRPARRNSTFAVNSTLIGFCRRIEVVAGEQVVRFRGLLVGQCVDRQLADRLGL